MLRRLSRTLGYYLGLAISSHLTSPIGNVKPEYNFSPVIKREEIVLPVFEIMNLYFDCNQIFSNSGNFRLTRTTEEIKETVQRRKQLEELLIRSYHEQVALSQFTSHPIDTAKGWHDPLDGKGRLVDNFNDPRPRLGRRREKHEALDIFVNVGSPVYSTSNSIVIASANDWVGEWNKKRGLRNPNGGLGDLTGNGALFFNIDDGSYRLVAHLKEVYVRTGEIIPAGYVIGTVGKTGNAIDPRLAPHLHDVFKIPGRDCGVDGTLIAQNQFNKLAEARGMLNKPVNVEESLY